MAIQPHSSDPAYLRRGKAKEFYVSWLGCKIDWEHRFEENTPKHIQVSRGTLVFACSPRELELNLKAPSGQHFPVTKCCDTQDPVRGHPFSF